MKCFLIIVSLVLTVTMFGCEPRHIRAYTPRHRDYKVGEYAATNTKQKEKAGSLWASSSPGYFEDLRASRIGDILSVKIDEQSKGKGDANTKLTSESGMESGMTNFLGLFSAIASAYPKMDPEKLISLVGKSDFKGQGTTSRMGSLEGRIAVQVKKIMPNGDMFIEGHKVILINEEELHFYVSGVVRQLDVQSDNSVRSSLIAEAQVEFSGRGVVADQQSPGWLHRLVDKYSPI